jgi:hypothetical protein
LIEIKKPVEIKTYYDSKYLLEHQQWQRDHHSIGGQQP